MSSSPWLSWALRQWGRKTANIKKAHSRFGVIERLEDRTLPDASGALGRILVQLKPNATATPALWSGLNANAAATAVDNVYEIRGTPAALSAIAQRVQVDSRFVGVVANRPISATLTPDDPRVTDGSQYGLTGTNGIQAPTAWNTTTGSTSVIVAVNDSGIDLNHNDLYRNIWINQDEIPAANLAAIQANPLWDIDGDGLVTFYDLNDPSNQGVGKITDGDANGIITASDLLRPVASGGWENGLSDDGDPYIDDIVGWDFVNGDNRPFDDFGHGTHVAGILGATGNNFTGGSGVLWKTQLMALKILNGTGNGADSDGALAIAYAAEHGARISNNSWSADGGYSAFLESQIAYAGTLDHLVVASAGNSAIDVDTIPTYLASFSESNVLAVASTTSTGARSSFSNYGKTTIDIGAPGSSVFSTYLNNSYTTLNGTSMAAPFVAGTAALTLAAHPTLDTAALKAKILGSATYKSGLSGRTVTGGLLNAAAAVADSPEIMVTYNDTVVNSGAETIAYGSILQSAARTRTITVTNVGTQNLTLASLTVPTGFSIASGFGISNLAPGAFTTFVIQLDGTTLGTKTGQVSFTTNDTSETSYVINVSGTVIADPITQIVDNSNGGFSSVGTWGTTSNVGYLNSINFNAAGTGNDSALWEFTVTPGVFRVSATWSPHVNRATDAPFTVFDGASPFGTIDLNQEVAPNDFTASGVAWENLGTFSITSAYLSVRLTDDANEFVIADGIRIQRIGDLASPDIDVADGSNLLTSNSSTVAFGSTFTGNAVSKTFTVSNSGGGTLNLGSVTVPIGYTITSPLGATTLGAGVSTTFTVQLNAATAGSYPGNITIGSNDSDEPTFTFAVTATVVNLPVVQIVDDGTTAFSTIGSWSTNTGFGYQSDLRNSAAGTGSDIATWTFSSNPGRYRISATWTTHVNRATDSPFSVYDGVNLLGTVLINQETAPADFTDFGVGWRDLGIFNITSSQLFVRLTDAANEYVIADAIRVERLGDIVAGAEISVFNGSTPVLSGTTTVNFGTVYDGTSVDRTFTVRNDGSSTLSLGALTVPTGYVVITPLGSTSLAPAATTTFSVRYSGNVVGTFSGNISLVTNDADENPFLIPVTGTTFALPTVQVVDNSSAAFNTSGAWTTFGSQGFNGTIAAAAAGTGSSVAQWAFFSNPGRYRISATWNTHANRATNSPFSVYDNTTLLSSVTVNQELAPNDFTYAGAAWEDLGVFNITTGGAIYVRLTNNANEFVIADAIRVERVGDLLAGPDIDVLDGTRPLLNGPGSVVIPSTYVGYPVARTFTVRNLGTSTLNLGAISVPSGFSVTTPLGTSTLAPSASTTFTVSLTAVAAGTSSGYISIASNDPDEPSFDFVVAGNTIAIPTTQVLDNSQPGFSVTGTWQTGSNQGYLGAIRFAAAGAGANVASWTFTVQPGRYRVSATWNSHVNRATNSPFKVYDGVTLAASASLNQQNAPNDFTASGAAWEDIAANVSITGGQLVVRLSDLANGYVIADGIRIERLGPIDSAADISVALGSSLLASGSTTVAYGSVYTNNPVVRSFTVTNVGSSTLNLTTLTVPAGYSIMSPLGVTSLVTGASTTFSVQLNASTAGSYSGNISLGSNDPDENPFLVPVTATVNAIPTIQIVDDSQTGFSTTGTWTSATQYGYLATVRFAAAGTGSNVATWTFAANPGNYRVSATWATHPNRATDAPYAVYDGVSFLSSIPINQEAAPNDFFASNAYWKDLGVFAITGNQLIVRLTNAANEYVIADAIRIERL